MVLLKLESGFARGVSQSLDSSVVKEAAAVEHDLLHAGGIRLVRDRLAHRRRRLHAVSLGLQRDRRRGGQRAAPVVVDDLCIEVIKAAEHGESRSLRGARRVHTHPPVALQPADLAVDSLDHPAALAPLPAFPALRRIFSPRYITPLPLYGSGGRIPRRLAATRPTASMEMPDTENFVGSCTSIAMPWGALYRMGCE